MSTDIQAARQPPWNFDVSTVPFGHLWPMPDKEYRQSNWRNFVSPEDWLQELEFQGCMRGLELLEESWRYTATATAQRSRQSYLLKIIKCLAFKYLEVSPRKLLS
jgi:hypothetical protein